MVQEWPRDSSNSKVGKTFFQGFILLPQSFNKWWFFFSQMHSDVLSGNVFHLWYGFYGALSGFCGSAGSILIFSHICITNLFNCFVFCKGAIAVSIVRILEHSANIHPNRPIVWFISGTDLYVFYYSSISLPTIVIYWYDCGTYQLINQKCTFKPTEATDNIMMQKLWKRLAEGFRDESMWCFLGFTETPFTNRLFKSRLTKAIWAVSADLWFLNIWWC